MKKNIIGSSLAILSILFAACSTKNSSDHTLQFERIEMERQAHLLNDISAPYCDFKVKIEYPTKGDSTLIQKINYRITEFVLGEKYCDLSPTHAVSTYIEQGAKEYYDEVEETYKADVASADSPEAVGSWYNYTYGIDSKVNYYKGNLLVIQNNSDFYTGGAHGMYFFTFMNLDLENDTQLGLKDVFKGSYEEELTKQLWKNLATQQKVNSIDELKEMGYGLIGELKPIENFSLNETGITFVYNPYEIAPYAMGITEIFISFQEINHLLNKENSIIKQLLN